MVEPHLLVEPRHTAIGTPVQCFLLVWPSVSAGAECKPVSFPQYPKKTVTISATPDAQVLLEGANMDDGPWYPIKDDEDCVAITSEGMYVLKENPVWIRPCVMRGTATIAIVAAH